MPNTDDKRSAHEKWCRDCRSAKPIAEFVGPASGRVYTYCRHCRNARSVAYSKRPEVRARRVAKDKRWYRQNREKRRAHTRVAKALRSGRLTRPNECSRCGANGLVHAHHDDYDRPLDIEWLCVPCHGALHALGGGA